MVLSMKGTCDCEEKSTVAQVHVMGCVIRPKEERLLRFS